MAEAGTRAKQVCDRPPASGVACAVPTPPPSGQVPCREAALPCEWGGLCPAGRQEGACSVRPSHSNPALSAAEKSPIIVNSPPTPAVFPNSEPTARGRGLCPLSTPPHPAFPKPSSSGTAGPWESRTSRGAVISRTDGVSGTPALLRGLSEAHPAPSCGAGDASWREGDPRNWAWGSRRSAGDRRVCGMVARGPRRTQRAGSAARGKGRASPVAGSPGPRPWGGEHCGGPRCRRGSVCD